MLRPIGPGVLLEMLVEESKVGMIHLPDGVEAPTLIARVRAVGEGGISNGVRIAPLVKPGDKVVVIRGSGFPIRVDGETLVWVSEAQILGIETEESLVKEN
jgi:chaperonin GroES